MFQISADLFTLSQLQREAVASFILTFPTETIPVQLDDEDALNIPAFTIPEAAFNLTAGPMLVESLPVPPPPPPVPTPSPVESNLDSAGLPWDERIHASSRAKVADGTWRKKRGVDAAAVAPVEAQLAQLMAVPAPAPTPVLVPAPAPVLVPAPVPPPPPVDGRAMYVELITKASSAIHANKLTQEELNGLVTAAGVPSLPLLANRLDLVPQVIASVDMLLASRQ